MDRSVLVVGAATGALSGLVVLGLRLAYPAEQQDAILDVSVRSSFALSCAFFVAAAVLRLSSWRLVRTRQALLVTIGVVLLAALAIPAGVLSRAVGTDADVVPLVRGLGVLACMGVLLKGLAAGRDSRAIGTARLARVALLAVALPLIAAGAVVATTPAVVGQRWLIGCAGAVAWVATGVLAARPGVWDSTRRRLMPSAIALAAAEMLIAAGAGSANRWTLLAALLYMSVGSSALIFSFRDLDAVVRTGREEIAEALADARTVAAQELSWRAEVAHDARNGCAGLRAALQTIDRLGAQLGDERVRDLRRAALEEITHLEHLLAGSTPQATETFDVVALVQSVVAAQRARGARIAVLAGAVEACGRSLDVATALQNILVNAERHAPGSAVIVNVRAHGERVAITIADAGPGIPAERRDLVFERGAHAAGSGSGLGLYRARSLMRAQGGDVVLREQHGRGACFVLTLPMEAETIPAPAAPVALETDPAVLRSLPRQRSAAGSALAESRVSASPSRA
ncbi:MAG: sensor histidine kinase [Marmoricola sp.]